MHPDEYCDDYYLEHMPPSTKVTSTVLPGHGMATTDQIPPGTKWSCCTCSVDLPAEMQSDVVTVLAQTVVMDRWVVLVRHSWDLDVPVGVWIDQEYFLAHFRREPTP